MLFLLAPSDPHLFQFLPGRDKAKFVLRGLGAGRHVGEAADMLAANSEQACNRPAAGGGWPAARPVWQLAGAY